MIFGFDFGTKKIGIAKGQTITQTASPLTTIKAFEGSPNWQSLDQLIEQWQPEAFVVGCALHADQTESKTALQAKLFGEALLERYNRPVHYIDEHLTSFEARLIAKEQAFDKSQIDAIAAMLILESWLKRR